MATDVYTDGACSGNPGPGGWAWAVPGGRWRSGAEPHTTNQRMEIAAVLDAVRTLPRPLTVHSDSTYVVNCWRDRWYDRWLAKGWVSSQRKPVANRDLWEQLVPEFQAGGITMRWVKGHGGDPMNDLVDRLAVRASLEQRGGSGDRPPGERAGPTDARPEDDDAVEGHAVLVAGVRPPALGGYDPNPVAERVRRQVAGALLAIRAEHRDAVVLAGMDLGAGQLGAEAAADAGLPWVAVLPYPSMESVWPEGSQQRFRSLVGTADKVVTVGTRPPADRRAAGAALARRDGWMVERAADAVVVWDGEDPAVARLLRTLRERLGDDRVVVVTP